MSETPSSATTGYIMTDEQDWFSLNPATWDKLLNHLKDGPRRILEIGCHEGRSATWLIENKLKAGDIFHGIDKWDTPPGTPPSAREATFDHNIKLALGKVQGVTVIKHKGRSNNILANLLATEGLSTFDLIYVDGGHEAPDVLSDLVYSFMLCKVGGMIICDDYLWKFGSNPAKTPKLAIDSFTNCFSEKLSIVSYAPLWQIYMRKECD